MRYIMRNLKSRLSKTEKIKSKIVLVLLILTLLANPSIMLVSVMPANGASPGHSALVHDVAVTNVAPVDMGLSPSVANDSSVDISVTVLNTGAFTESFGVGVFANSTSVAPNQTVTNLSPGEQTYSTFVWNTTGWALGGYALRATAYLPGDPTPSDNSMLYPYGIVSVVTDEAAYELQHQNTTLFTEPSAVESTSLGQDFTVNIRISNVYNLWEWSAGIDFNSSILKCTGFYEGDFLKESAEFTGFTTMSYSNPSNQLESTPLANDFLADLNVAGASGSGQLAYLKFTSVGIGVSDIRLIDTYLMSGGFASNGEAYIPAEVIESFTVPSNGTNFGVQVADNVTGVTKTNAPSGLFNAVFNATDKEIRFDVLSMENWFLQISVPKKLLTCNLTSQWTIKVDGIPISYTATETAVATALSFQRVQGNHTVEIIGTNVLGENLNFPPAQSLAPPSLLVAIAASLCVVTLLVALVDLRRTRSFRAPKESTKPVSTIGKTS
ncbi:MAG: CARDB domain-containing protein [Candidatus Bathyarchaeia archaeon]